MRKTRLVALALAGSGLSFGCAAGAGTPDDVDAPAVTRAPDGAEVVSVASGALTAPSRAPLEVIVRELVRARGAGRAADALLLAATSAPAAPGRDVTHVRMEQRVGARRVVGAYVKAAVNARGEVEHLVSRVGRVDGALPAPDPRHERAALAAALRYHGYPAQAPAGFFHRAPTVEAIAWITDDGGLAPGSLVVTWTERGNALHHTIVGDDGAVVAVEERTADDSYLAFPVSPLAGPQVSIEGDGWLDAGAQYVYQLGGNSVRAYLDTDANNAADAAGAAIVGEDLLAVHDPAVAPSTDGNRAVSVQNLFVLGNRLHDLLYAHGFDEAAGNFQSDNFGLGGLGNDALIAESQDGSGVNNANMACTEDGLPPRIQMYLYTGALDSQVVVGGTAYAASLARFGGTLTTTGLTKTMSAFVDRIAPAGDACSTYLTSLSNRIALIEPNNCDFTTKVYNAQRAGAVAAIVINAIPGRPFPMTAVTSSATIPGIMVSDVDGAALRTKLGQSVTVRKNATAPLMIDAALDADIVTHEYAHGLLWRMIGGMSGKLAGAVGEGAADVLALLVNGGDRIGEYARSNPFGSRRWPYSVHPLTYADVTGDQVHYDGEIFAAAMYNVIENYEAAGLTRDDVLHDFVQGMSYTPATPAYETMRDGMLAAADASRDCYIWRGFAASGVGVGATGKLNKKGNVVITASFTVPAACQ